MDGSTKLKGMISPITSTGLVAFPSNKCIYIAREWQGFTAEIKRKYKIELAGMPKIHMRYLWGKNSFRDKHKNPFYGMPEIERNLISKEAYELLVRINLREKGHLRVFQSFNIETQEKNFQFFNSQRQLTDRELIYSRFRKGGVAEKFFKLLMHSTMSLISQTTMQFSEEIAVKGDNGIINYDDSDASKGFDAEDLFDAMHDFGFANSIRYGKHGDTLNSCLLQMADLLSFYAYKRALSLHRAEANWEDNEFSKVCPSINEHYKARNLSQTDDSPSFQAIAMHYLVARRYLATIDSDWVDQHLLTAGELHSKFNP